MQHSHLNTAAAFRSLGLAIILTIWSVTAQAAASPIGETGGLESFHVQQQADGRFRIEARDGRWRETVERFNTIFLKNGPLTLPHHGQPLNVKSLVSGSAIRLIHHRGPIKIDFVEKLQAVGLTILDYIPENAYVVFDRGDQTRAAMTAISTSLDYLREWSPTDRLHFKLANNTQDRDVTVYLVEHPDNANSRKMLETAALARYMGTSRIKNCRVYRLRLSADSIAKLSRRPDIYWIEPFTKPQLADERQGVILSGAHNGILPNGPGYKTWLDQRIDSQSLAQIRVDVTDSGCDRGTPASVAHPDLVGRIAVINNYTGQSVGNDVDGHGTLNVGIVGGYPPSGDTGSGLLDDSGYLYGAGIAPGASLACSRIFDAAEWDIGSHTLTDIVKGSYEGGSLISSNSWGSPDEGQYTAESQEYDALVRDADRDTSNGLQPIIILFAAGNEGDDNYLGRENTQSIISPGTAKNVITVGATENVRMTGTDGCDVPNSGADDLGDLIDFSSRGPCSDGRRKPDVVAPGTHIQSAASSDPDYGAAQGVCDFYWPAGQTRYAWSSGTSHSTPATAGVAAIYSAWYKQAKGVLPSPALMKAMLSVHTDDIAGGDNGFGSALEAIPSQRQGWGLIDMAGFFLQTPRRFVDQTHVLYETGTSFSIDDLRSADPAKPVKISLAWTDAPGSTSGNAYSNNLDLFVTVDGRSYKGNVFANGTSTTGGSFDEKNNLENVFLPPGDYASIEVEVIAANLPANAIPGSGAATAQDFALYLHNIADREPCTADTDCSSSAPCLTPYCDDDGFCAVQAKCDDQDVCTDDACDPANGTCTYTSIDCGDANACTTDTCDPQAGCQHTDVDDCTLCNDGRKVCVDGLCGGHGTSVTESFESGSIPSYWTTGEAAWTATSSTAQHGSYSAQSPQVTDWSGSAWLEVAITLAEAGTVSFQHKQNFTVSGSLTLAVNGGESARWESSSDTWQNHEAELSAGTNTLRWTVSNGWFSSSQAWIDTVVFSGIGGGCSNDNPCQLGGHDGTQCVLCNLPDGWSCDDDLWCNGGDACQNGQCQRADPPVIDDGIPCTLDSCVESGNGNGQVLHEPDDSLCQNGLFCDGPEVCDISRGCEAGETPSFGDGITCTEDVCNEGNDLSDNLGEILHLPDNGACVSTNPCMAGTCSPTSDCEYAEVLDGTACQISSGAIGNCQDGSCVVECQSDSDCNDGIPCTLDSCNPQSAKCEQQPDDSACDDGNACTDDRCQAWVGCVPEFDDSNPCDDGLFCSINDHCESGVCLAEANPCTDAISCTEDSCDETSRACLHQPDDSVCDDGLDFTEDSCDDSAGCVFVESGHCDNPILIETPYDHLHALGNRGSHLDAYGAACGPLEVYEWEDAVFTLEAMTGDLLDVTLKPLDFDGALIVLSDCAENQPCQAFVDQGSEQVNEHFTHEITQDGPIFLVVENRSQRVLDAGQFRLVVSLTEADGDVDGDQDEDEIENDETEADGDQSDGDQSEAETIESDGDDTSGDGDLDAIESDDDEKPRTPLDASGCEGCSGSAGPFDGLLLFMLLLLMLTRRRIYPIA